MNKQKEKRKKTISRAKRTRAVIFGTNQKPRLSVFKSALHIYAQLIDDENGKTLASVHSKKFIKEKGKKLELAERTGKELAKLALAKDIKQAIFDRGANRYHGRVKALAEGARAGGLKF